MLDRFPWKPPKTLAGAGADRGAEHQLRENSGNAEERTGSA